MKRICSVGLAFGMAAAAMAGGNGETAASFLTLPAGARSAAMGEGGMALASDAHALYLNPAGMAGLDAASVVGTHGAYIDSSYFDQMAYVNPKSKWGAWGVGIQYFNSGSIEGVDKDLNPTGAVTPSDLAITGSYGRGTGPVRWGVGVKYIQSKLVDTASTMSLDLGVESKPLVKDKLRLGLVGQNLTGSLKYDQESNDLPRAIKAGAGYAMGANLDVTVDAVFPKGEDSYYGLGAEYRFRKGTPWELDLRGGYNTRTSNVDGFTGFTMGMGVKHNQLTVDYAFLPFGEVGSTHWITLGWQWAGK